MKVFLQGDSYAPVGFCLTGGPIFLEETNQYKMGEAGQRKHSLFLDDLKPLSRKPSGTRDRKENYCKASMDTGACYGGKKYGEIVFRVGKMIVSLFTAKKLVHLLVL